jgi:nucleotide-binding universal stress UspA family protein
VDAQLIGLATKAQADLIVVGTHQWHGLSRLQHGSVSRGILHHAPMSVACVPTPAAAPMAGPRIRECRRVLAAADLGASHGFAAPYAYSIVDPGGTVRLVHVVEPFWMTNPLIGRYYQDLPTRKEHAQQVAEFEARLRSLAPAEVAVGGIKTEVEVLEDLDTAKAICAGAERFNADVVCIGGHTRPGFTAKILGSVALGVLTQCRRPVLIVWPPAE